MPILRASCPERRWMRAVLAVAVLCNGAEAAPTPVIELPPDTERFSVGDRLVLNGLPMRIDGFLSQHPAEPLVAWFRTRLGTPLVENDFAGAKILGRAQGDHYVTVRIESAGRGSRGIVAITDLRSAYDNRIDTEAAAESLLARMPSGSKLLSQQVSVDAGRISRHLIVLNRHSEALNRTRVEAMLRDDGLSLELASNVPPQRPAAGSGQTLYFRAPGKEAVATIFRDARGDTFTVLNSITQMERMP